MDTKRARDSKPFEKWMLSLFAFSNEFHAKIKKTLGPFRKAEQFGSTEELWKGEMLMAIGEVGMAWSSGSGVYRRARASDDDFYAGISGASEKTEEKNGGKVLGLTMIPYGNTNISYGMKAQYAAGSTEENPIIQVTSNYGGKTVSYNVNIREVDPENAFWLEMFALCSYADDKGLGKGGTFGSWQKLKVYAENAGENGYCGNPGGYNDFLYKKFDWKNIIGRMMEDFLRAGIYDQYQDGKNLISMFESVENTQTGAVQGKAGTNKANPDGEEEKKLGEMDTEDLMEFLREKKEEIFEKLRNGDTEPSFQIGASSFTEKEWEEFLGKFDSIEEAIRELVAEERERREAAKSEEEIRTEQEAKNWEGLVSESTSCTYSSSEPEKEEITYITWYTEDGIYCRQAGQTEGYFWSLEFDDPSRYQRVMGFLKQFPADENLRFAAHENFWQDFLAGKIEEEDFVKFFNSTNHGIPDYTYTEGDSTYIDKEKLKYASYMNPFGNQMLTQTELMAKQAESC